MSRAAVLLAEIRAAGAVVGLDGGALRVRVPKGVLTVEQRERLIQHHADIVALLAEPANDRTHRDLSRCVPLAEIEADLQAAFADDGPASDAAQRPIKVEVSGGPAGDDLAAWQSWMDDRWAYQQRCGFSPAEALRITWGQAEDIWHRRYHPAPDPCRCAGCGERLLPGEGLPLIDGAVVHIGDPEVVECLAVYGAHWRGTASTEMAALGLVRPA